MQNANQANNSKEFLGITQNECSFQGQVQGDPVVTGDNYAFFYLKVMVGEQDANGQWSDVPVMVPVFTMDPRQVKVISNYIQDGRRILVYTYYKSWQNEGQPQHGFVVKKISLGRKKWNPENATPGLPS